MSAVVGIDLSTKAIDLVKLPEETNDATWERANLNGGDAWARTLTIRDALPTASWWADVYLVAIEAPYGRAQGGTQAKLNRVVGAIVSALPGALRRPERCWIVRPDEWKTELGLKKKPTVEDVERLLPGCTLEGLQSTLWLHGAQDQWDALCLALFARQVNAKAILAADRR